MIVAHSVVNKLDDWLVAFPSSVAIVLLSLFLRGSKVSEMSLLFSVLIKMIKKNDSKWSLFIVFSNMVNWKTRKESQCFLGSKSSFLMDKLRQVLQLSASADGHKRALEVQQMCPDSAL